MRSHLTRYVFRQILRNRPWAHGHCIQRNASYLIRPPCDSRLPARVATRSFFWSTKKPPRVAKEAEMDAGFAELTELRNRLKMKARPPPGDVVLQNLKDFFAGKGKRTPILDTQVEPVLVACQYLLEGEGEKRQLGLSATELKDALRSLRSLDQAETTKQGAICELASILYEQSEQNRGYFDEPSEVLGDENIAVPGFAQAVFLHYLYVLSTHGQAHRAFDLLREEISKDPSQYQNNGFWEPLLGAFIRSKKESAASETIRLMEEFKVQLNNDLRAYLMQTYDSVDNFAEAKKWYDSLPRDAGMSIHTSFLRMCIMRQDFETGQPVLNKLLERQYLNASAWTASFMWAAAIGKGAEEIDRMMDVMVRRMEQSGHPQRPGTATINSLIRLAISMNDSYMTERFIALAERRQIPLDGLTHMLQMESRLNTGDIAGARAAFKQAQSFELPEGLEAPMINKLVQQLCASKAQNHEIIMEYVEELTDRKGNFEPATVAALSKLHLRRGELHDAVDLLRTHAHHFGQEQRAILQQTLCDLIQDRTHTSTAAAWDAYCILKEIFSEMDIDIRTSLMIHFFARRRCDMGIYVFGHMRQSQHMEKRPTVATYIECFKGIAELRDLDSLELVHNMLKLDYEVELDTSLRNALMLAYLNCDKPFRVLEFWDDIIYSREGPTYSSICIALRACEAAPFGDKHADDIWRKLQRFQVQPTLEIYSAYVGALGGQGMVDEAIEAVANMEKAIATKPDFITIGTLCNTPRQDLKKHQVEEWAKTNYPDIYDELESLGRTSNKLFKIDRKLSI